MNIGDHTESEINVANLNLASKAILDKLNKVIRNVDYNFDKYDLGEAAKALYNFVWNDFASWYVEISKVDLQSDDEANKINTKNVLIYTLKAIIKMLHPFCPFITEELYQALPHDEESISISEWPKANPLFDDEQASLAFDDLCEVITSIRNERAKANKAPSKPIDITISCKDEDALNKLKAAESYLIKFTNPKNLVLTLEQISSEGNVLVVLSKANFYIPYSDLVDAKEAKAKLEATKAKLENELNRSRNMLNNPNFTSKAPAQKIENERAKLADYEAQYKEVCEALAKF